MAATKRNSSASAVPSKQDIGKEVLKLVELMHEEKKVARDVIFTGIEQAISLATLRHYAAEDGVYVHIDRSTGEITARYKETEVDPVTLGRISAQSAKQVMIQKIREAESDTTFKEFHAKEGELVVGSITRVDAGTAVVSLGKHEAILPRSEQIPGESFHVGERVKAVVYQVRKNGQRVKIVLSRAHGNFVKALFEEEIPEIDDRTIDIRSVSREAGHRTKVAVSSVDSKVDAVGACVGVRGSRIKNVIEELNGERIDIVRWNDSLQVLIPNALQPAQISDVFTYPRLGRAIVLVTDDQLSLAIGRRGQNVRLASKLVGMDIEIMTHEELGESLERAERWFAMLPIEAPTEDNAEPARISPEQVQMIIEEGFLSYNELSYIDGADLSTFTGLTEEQANEVILYAEEYAKMMEESVEEERRQADEAAAAAQAEAADQADSDSDSDAATADATEQVSLDGFLAGEGMDGGGDVATASQDDEGINAEMPSDDPSVMASDSEDDQVSHDQAFADSETSNTPPDEGESRSVAQDSTGEQPSTESAS